MPARHRWITVSGYRLRGDIAYDPASHMWLAAAGDDPSALDRDGGPVRIGFDPLGLEINGTLAQLALDRPGVRCSRGDAIGSLEAEKFVGPVVAPLSGTVGAVNDAVLSDPARVQTAPFEAWIVEIDPDPDTWEQEATSLVHGEEAICEWFTAALRRYRLQGVLAE